jgi:hypothetical protein
MTDKKKIILMVGLPILLLGGIGLYLATRKKLPKTDTNKNDKKNTTNCCKMNPIPAGCTGCGGGHTPHNVTDTYTDVYTNGTYGGTYDNTNDCLLYQVNTVVSNLNVRSTPSTTSSILKSLTKGTIISAKPSSTGGWMELCNGGGFVSSQYLKSAE